MHIARVVTEVGERFGIAEGRSFHPFGAGVCFSALCGASEAELSAMVDSKDHPVAVDGLQFLNPVPAPSKIVCVGLNYRDHADESGQAAPERPLLFAKFPSALVGPGEAISWPSGLTSQVDWEGELGVVVGARLSGASPSECLDGVFGYTAANDVSARDVQFGDVQWVRGKSLDTFCPVGPEIVTRAEFGDPQRKTLRTLINGARMQDGTTADMIFPVAELLSWICAQISLVPGDLVLTGTPPGVGAYRTPPVFLAAGDVVEVQIEGIRSLRSPVAGSQ